MRPDAQLKVQPTERRFLADETQHRQIPLALRVRQRHGAHVVARRRNQKRIGEIKITIAEAARGVVSQPERQVEAVETLRGQFGEIALPKRAVVEPRFVLDIAGECT